MEHNKATYFVENEEPNVKGFTIIETGDEQYHIAEKWDDPNDSEKWLSYWIEAEELAARIGAGHCEKKAELTDKQFEKVCGKIDHSKVVA